jgi:hypothetical protein
VGLDLRPIPADGALRMRYWLYLAIITLSLYGDLIKRYVAPDYAVIVVYSFAIVILLAILRTPRVVPSRAVFGARAMRRVVTFLVAVYWFQLLTTSSSQFVRSLTHAIYMSVPLMYILVVQRCGKAFNLSRLANMLLWFMIPINAVGFIQFSVDPSFLITTAYTPDGGVMMRNFLRYGSFARYPSIFVSADRYSAMGLMQIYFSFVLFAATGKKARTRYFWIGLNVVAGFAALLVAGARSRILIAVAVLAAGFMVTVVGVAFAAGQRYLRSTVSKTVTLLIVALTIATTVISTAYSGRDVVLEVPVLNFLRQSLDERDLSGRVLDATDLSMLPEDVTFFGQGLGSVGEGGKPGEFGIYSIWIESGVFWGLLLLMGFLGMVAILAWFLLRALLAKQAIDVVLTGVPLLLLVFALLAGLTSTFELSSGILIGCAIAALTHEPTSDPNRGSERVRPGIDSYLPMRLLTHEHSA